MTIRPEDRSKLIGIIVGIVAVNLFLAVKFLPRLMGGQPATAQQNAAPKPPAASAASTSAASASQAAAGTLPPSAPVDAGTSAAGSGGGANPPANHVSDPFTPPHGTPMPEEPQPKSQMPPTVANVAPPSVLPKLTPQAIGSKPTAPKMPEIRLKGIIDGEPSVAVFQIDEETTYRQEGEKVADGVRVAQISEAGVTLKQGKQNRFLDVGHSLADKPSTPIERAPATPPTAPAASNPPKPAANAHKPTAKRVAVRKSRAVRRQARRGIRKGYARAPRKLRRVVRRNAPRRPAFAATRRVVRRRI